jgi:recombination protein RecT
MPDDKLAKVQPKTKDFRDMLEKAKPVLASVLPAHIKPERLIRIALAAISRNQDLLNCDQNSILQSVMTASQLGLEPNTPLGHSYLVAYWNSKLQRKEAQFIPGYRGLIELARRSGSVQSISAHLVHDKDEFSYEEGTSPKIVHKPCLTNERGKVRLAYAVAFLKDTPLPQVEVMTLDDLNKIKMRTASKKKDGSIVGPWVTDEGEMQRKTVVKRLCKYLPMTIELMQAVGIDNAVETEEPIDYEVLELAAMPSEHEEDPANGSAGLKADLKTQTESKDDGKLI